MLTPPTDIRELQFAFALRLEEIVVEVQSPGYHGHDLIPRFWDEIRSFVQNLDEFRDE